MPDIAKATSLHPVLSSVSAFTPKQPDKSEATSLHPVLQALLDMLSDEVWVLPAVIGSANTLKTLSAQVILCDYALMSCCCYCLSSKGERDASDATDKEHQQRNAHAAG